MAATKKAQAKKKVAKPLDALVFVDTNILLDFYRLAESNVRLEFLQLLEDNLASLILTDQVEMEFKKGRQSVLKKWLTDSKLFSAGETPPSLMEHKLAKDLAAGVKKANDAVKGLQEKVKGAIKQPNSDIVFKRLNAVFSHNGPYVLNSSKSSQSKIRHLARLRFSLGYPPRKNDDISIGDAVNWEWMVECARVSKKSLIIVSRDTDYGMGLDGKAHLNDWLLQEFRERTSPRRKVVVTRLLTEAVKLISKKSVSKQAEAAEKQVDLTADIVKNTNINWLTHQAAAQTKALLQSYREEFAHEVRLKEALGTFGNLKGHLSKADEERAMKALDAIKGETDSFRKSALGALYLKGLKDLGD